MSAAGAAGRHAGRQVGRGEGQRGPGARGLLQVQCAMTCLCDFIIGRYFIDDRAANDPSAIFSHLRYMSLMTFKSVSHFYICLLTLGSRPIQDSI